MKRLAALAERERMRWRDLVWMLISWALRRRPYQERQGLVEIALEYQPDPTSQEEVQSMSTALGQTLEEWAKQQGIEQGKLAASRKLLRRLLEDRFGSLPDAVHRAIDVSEDLGRLEQAIRRTPRLQSPEELEL